MQKMLGDFFPVLKPWCRGICPDTHVTQKEIQNNNVCPDSNLHHRKHIPRTNQVVILLTQI